MGDSYPRSDTVRGKLLGLGFFHNEVDELLALADKIGTDPVALGEFVMGRRYEAILDEFGPLQVRLQKLVEGRVDFGHDAGRSPGDLRVGMPGTG